MYRPQKKKTVDPVKAHNDFWKEILIMSMHSLGLKKVVVSNDVLLSLSKSCPPGEVAYLITTKVDENPNSIGFTLHLAYGNEERDAITGKK